MDELIRTLPVLITSGIWCDLHSGSVPLYAAVVVNISIHQRDCGASYVLRSGDVIELSHVVTFGFVSTAIGFS